MIVPQIDVDGIARRGLLTPEFARGETHGVEMLRPLALEMRVRVGKNEDAMIALDRADFATRVARQARVPGRIDIAAANMLPHLEARYRWDVALHGIASGNHRRHRFAGDPRRGFWVPRPRLAAFASRAVDPSPFARLFPHAGGPFGKHQIAELGGAVMNADLHVFGQLESKFAQHAARVDYGARTIRRGLVPDRG